MIARSRRGGWDVRRVAWLAVAAALPAGAAAVLELARGSASNGDVALLLMAAVLVVALGGRVGPIVVAAGSAALAYDYFHTRPYHSLTIANGNDVVATVLLGLVALAIGVVATRAARAAEELVLVVVVAAFSLAVPEPARVVLDHRGLDACLAALVLVTALTIPLSRVTGLRARSRRLLAALAASTLVLPALSWAVARLVTAASLRRGVTVVGVAPTEIASVAATSLAAGDAGVSAALLVASTLVTIGGAGIALRALGGAGPFDAAGLVGHLALIVGAPLLIGLFLRARVGAVVRAEEQLTRVSLALVTVLVWLVASQVRLSSAYFGVTAALVLFLAGSAAVGVVLGWRATPPVATAVLLSTSMRDFAIAAGIAVAAYGVSASAPLALYGVLVLVWGLLVAALRRTVPPSERDERA
jgi:predicted Na+-dependent transporter